MPIEFPCGGCAKQLRVPDTAGGKMTRCPACGVITTAPVPEPQFEIVEPPAPPPPVEVQYAETSPIRKNRRNDPEEDDARPMALAEPEPPRRKKRRRRLKPSRTIYHDSSESGTGYQIKRVMFIGLGAVIVTGGVVAMFTDDRPVRFFRAIGAIIVGGGLIIAGITGNFGDE